VIGNETAIPSVGDDSPPKDFEPALNKDVVVEMSVEDDDGISGPEIFKAPRRS